LRDSGAGSAAVGVRGRVIARYASPGPMRLAGLRVPSGRGVLGR